MNDLQLSTPVVRPGPTAQAAAQPTAASTARPSALDRLELRVGLWLLLRSSRRRRAARDYAEQHRLHINRELLTRREQEHLHAHLLTGVRF